MAKQNVGSTALGAAVCRLIEQFQPEEIRLFNDPVVKYLVGTLIRMLMQFASVRNFTIKQTGHYERDLRRSDLSYAFYR